MNNTITQHRLFKTAIAVVMCMLLLVTNQQVQAQAGCSIIINPDPGCPQIAPVCATTEQNGVFGATVSWAPPSFSLSCAGDPGSGYAFNMSFDLPESRSAASCWQYNRVQRVGTDGGKLRLWQSSGTGNPWVKTPAFYMGTTPTSLKLTINAVENFTVKVYLINTTTLVETEVTPVPALNITTGLHDYPFTISAPAPGGYKIRLEFVGGSSNANEIQVLSINAIVIDGCVGDVNFVTTSNYNPPAFFPVGTTTVTYTATCNSCDPVITATCSFPIVVNGIKAAITNNTATNCGLSNGSITFDTTLANASQVQYMLDAGAWTTISAPFTIGGLSAGPHTLNVRALFGANYCSILAPLSFTIAQGADVTNPTIITCPPPKSAFTIAGICAAFVPDFTADVVADDDCGGSASLTITQAPAAGALAGLGPQQIVITVKDAAGNTATCNTTFTVIDNSVPVITSCAANQSASTTTGTCTAPVPDFTANVIATDNCTVAANLTKTQSPAAGTLVGPGPHTVTITVTDAANNTTTCTATFTVTDNSVPVITSCAANQSASTTTGTCTAPVPDFTSNITATDNCTGSANLVITQSPAAGTLVGPGPHTVTITVTDAANNSATCTATFTVTDNSLPTISSCATNQSASTTTGTCTAPVPNFAANVVASDNCTGSANLTITQSPAAGTLVGPGPHTVTITVTDAANNSATCTATFTVTDNTKPTITSCAAPQSATTGSVNCSAAVPSFTANVTATDNCTGSANLTITQSPAAGTMVEAGVHTITITVTDQYNNFQTCTTTFTVIDNVSPVITTCPTAQTANAVANCSAPVPNFAALTQATDICTAAGSLVKTQVPAAGTQVGLGAHTITITVKDAAGNSTTCTTVFTVVDNTAPVFNCPAGITTPDDGCGTAVLSITAPTATDNCSVLTVTGVRSDNLPLTAPYPRGTTVITWTATDANNQSTSCTQTIVVTKATGTILANYTFLGFTAYPFNANETAPGISSNVNSTEPFAYSGSGTPTLPGAYKTNPGTNEALVLQPSSGNNTRYIQFVVSGNTLKFYSKFKVYFDAERQPQGATTLTLAYSLDGATYTNVGTPLSLMQQSTWYEGIYDLSSIAALNTFNLTNIYFRIYASGSDAKGVSDATRLEVDNFQVFASGVAPIITCPGDKTVTVNAATDCSAAVDPGTATGEGKCGPPTITSMRSDGKPLSDPYPVGTTTITWKATDGDGNFTTCTQTIVVKGLIDAVNDEFSISGNGGIAGNVLDNDYLNCQQQRSAPNVVITVITRAASDNVVLDPNTGDVIVEENTPEDDYYITYRICDITDPTKCDEAVVHVMVTRILPVNGLVLKGSRNSSDVHLNWQTLTENNTSYFIMERSFDGIRFEPIPVGSKVPAAGNSNAQRNYSLVDKNAIADIIYYRVKLYDNSGNMKMSNLVAVTMNLSKKLKVFPNPVRDFVTIEFGENGTYQIDLISDIGQLITLQKEVQVTNSFRTMTMQRNNLISGQYQMRIWNKTTGSVNTFRLVYLPKNQ